MTEPSPNSVTDGFLRITHCESVPEFLQYLSRRDGLLATGLPDTWIYRGVVDEKHTLTPSALRRESRFRDLVGWDAGQNGDQRYGEMWLLKDFFERADRIALALPEDTQTLRRSFESKLPAETTLWPPETFHRITLPRSHASELLQALEIEGVTRATLFPNFYGVVEAMAQSGRYRSTISPSEQAKMLRRPG